MPKTEKIRPVLFYRMTSGREPVRDWLKELSPVDKRVIGEDVKTVEYGQPIGMPVCRTMGDGLWEVRSNLPNGAIKRLLVWQIEQLMKDQDLSKAAMAKRMRTSRAALNRLLDPENESVTLQTLQRAAQSVGKHLRLELVG